MRSSIEVSSSLALCASIEGPAAKMNRKKHKADLTFFEMDSRGFIVSDFFFEFLFFRITFLFRQDQYGREHGQGAKRGA